MKKGWHCEDLNKWVWKTLLISAAAGPTGNIYGTLVIALCSPNHNIFSAFLPASSRYYTTSGAIALDCYNHKMHRKIDVKQGSSHPIFLHMHQ